MQIPALNSRETQIVPNLAGQFKPANRVAAILLGYSGNPDPFFVDRFR
jgi:hypothetical protein